MRLLRWSGAFALATALAVNVVPAASSGAKIPPVRIKSLSLGRNPLPAKGGATVLRFNVQHGDTCWVTAPAAVTVNRKHRGCRAGKMATNLRLKAIDSLHPAHYRIYAWVHGRDKRTLKRSVVLGQRALAPVAAKFSPSSQPVVTKAYSQRFTATGGRAPYTWAVVGGSLPSGLTLSRSGVLTGTPTKTGGFSAIVRATDSSTPTHFSANVNVAFTVAPPPLAATAPQLPHGSVGQGYSATLSATGGTGPYKWAVVGGSLPAGISLSTGGQLTGTPTAAGTFTASVQVTDSSSSVQRVTESISLVIAPPPVTVAPVLPTGYTGQSYSATLTATGGRAPYTWSIASGSLDGLSLSSSGVIGGVPGAAGTFSASVRVTDSSSPQATTTTTVTLHVVQSLAITTTSLPAATHGSSYTTHLAASGGTGSYTWAAANLPSGLVMSSSGTLSGTATTAGNYPIIVVVTDTSSPIKQVAEKSFTLAVN